MSEAREPKMMHLKGKSRCRIFIYLFIIFLYMQTAAEDTWVDQWRCYYLAGLLGNEGLGDGRWWWWGIGSKEMKSV